MGKLKKKAIRVERTENHTTKKEPDLKLREYLRMYAIIIVRVFELR